MVQARRSRAQFLILVVDDDEDLRSSLVELLRAEGFAAEAVANGRLALERLQAMSQEPALIILDLMMPEMDGCQFREAQQNLPRLRSIPVILATAAADGADRAQALGVEGFLRKPVVVEELKYLANTICTRRFRQA